MVAQETIKVIPDGLSMIASSRNWCSKQYGYDTAEISMWPVLASMIPFTAGKQETKDQLARDQGLGHQSYILLRGLCFLKRLFGND